VLRFNVPDQRYTTPLRFVLHGIREKGLFTNS